MKKNILFVHQHFPAQFKHLAPELAKKHNVHSLSLFDFKAEGVKHHKYAPKQATNEKTHDLAKEFEAKIIRAEGCANKAYELKNEGFTPDLIIGHHGWGELMFLSEVYPTSKILSYLEFHYQLYGSDIDFDEEQQEDMDEVFLRRKLIGRNASFFSQYEISNYFLTPTEFQKSTFPKRIKDKIKVIHEGINTDIIKPNNNVEVKLNDFDLNKEKKVVLFVNRNLEPYRGYHIFMRSLPNIFKEHPDALIIIVGGELTSYGKKAPDGTTWKEIFFNEVKDSIDLERVLFTGYLEDHSKLTALMQSATVQVYLTYPFVLSWSLLESLACELLVIGSDTEPVKEVIKDGENGLLVDFFDHEAIAKKVSNVLADPKKYDKIRKKARKDIIKKYDLTNVCLPNSIKYIEDILKD